MTRQGIKTLLVLPIFLVFSACASKETVPFHVSSNPPGAKIYVNDAYVGDAPTVIKLTMKKKWAGNDDKFGWVYGNDTYKVSAHPPQKGSEKLAIKTKLIEPSITPDGAKIHFDLTSKPAQATQTIE